MKRILSIAAIALAVTFATAQEKTKVILDTDMVEIFDDGVAMMMLQINPDIELLGITTVVGNSWVNEGTAWALRQLEAVNAADKVPVAMGVTRPLRPDRHELMKNERPLFGIGHDDWAGSFSTPEPESWQAVYKKFYGSEPTVKPIDQHAVDFIIEQVKKHPGEVTIAAIGPCTNLAVAVRKAPEIVPMIKSVIYMGGSFFRQGNTTPAAEFNWWADPEAAKIAVRTPFKEQIIVGLDVCEKITFHKHQFEHIRSLVKNPIVKQMLDTNVLNKLYADDPKYTHYIWDVLVAAILIDPTLITEEVTLPVDVTTDYGLSYGQSLAYIRQGPAGTQKARIIKNMDVERVWKMLHDYCEKF